MEALSNLIEVALGGSGGVRWVSSENCRCEARE
jgi:hypothetical protein